MTAMASGVTSDEAGMVGIAARAWDATENWVAKAPRDAEIEFVHASAFARPGGSRRIVVIGETIPSGGVRGVGAFGSKDAENGDAGPCEGTIGGFGKMWGVPFFWRSSSSLSTSVDHEPLVSRLAMSDSCKQRCNGVAFV